MSRFNPFRGLPNSREVAAWGMYDLANQSFQLLINTLLFGVYLTEVVAKTPEEGKAFWATIVPVALLLVVAASPLMGAIADSRAWKKAFLVGTGAGCVLLTCALGFIGPGQLWLAAAIYIPAAFMCGIGENFLASFLPELATSKNMGRVSALGWAMSYVGALVLQAVVLVAIMVFGWKTSAQWRPLFIFAGVWFLVGMIPTMLVLKERLKPPPPGGHGTLLATGFSRLASTVRDARRYRQLLRFLAVFFIYSLGTQTVVYFAGIITKDLGFSNTALFLLTLLLSVMAGLAAIVTGRYQDAIGSRRTILIFLSIWAVSTLGLAIMTLGPPRPWLFWVLALGVGLGLGGIGTGSRALVGLFTPAHKSAEFFGLWGMDYKLAGVVGPWVFAMVYVKLGTPQGLFLLAGFFVTGLVLMLLIDEREGLAAARDAEEQLAREAVTPGDVAAAAMLGAPTLGPGESDPRD